MIFSRVSLSALGSSFFLFLEGGGGLVRQLDHLDWLKPTHLMCQNLNMNALKLKALDYVLEPIFLLESAYSCAHIL